MSGRVFILQDRSRCVNIKEPLMAGAGRGCAVEEKPLYLPEN